MHDEHCTVLLVVTPRSERAAIRRPVRNPLVSGKRNDFVIEIAVELLHEQMPLPVHPTLPGELTAVRGKTSSEFRT
jgi:hypothetical protein